MIYVTGDVHGDPYARLCEESFPEQEDMTRNDTVIICGDFGCVWNYTGETTGEKDMLDWLENRSFVTVFIDGNHENFRRLNKYPVKKWKGGNVHVIRPHVFHLMRGEVYTIEGKTFFAFGGARSHDISDGIIPYDEYWKQTALEWTKQGKMFRVEDISWWKEEMPSKEEMEHGRKELRAHNFQVDYVLTHCAPTFVSSMLSYGVYKPDELTDYFQSLVYEDGLSYKKWFFGHYHDNRMVTDQFLLLFEQIIRIS